MEQTYQVKLDVFEGPLDLLLHLINKYEIDIYDIPVATITDQYITYLQTMQRLELNIASEYLVMAASLLAIKSQMLLPKPQIDEDANEYMEDPREELMHRLIEYRKYKQVAEQLQAKELNDKQTFTRSPVMVTKKTGKVPMEKDAISVYDMLGALHKMFERKSWDEPLDTRITKIEIHLDERMDEILHVIKEKRTGISFDQLFPYPSRSHIVITFIALLE